MHRALRASITSWRWSTPSGRSSSGMEKALVWKDVLFMKMSLREAAKAHNARVGEKGRICKSTVDNWVKELNARFEVTGQGERI